MGNLEIERKGIGKEWKEMEGNINKAVKKIGEIRRGLGRVWGP